MKDFRLAVGQWPVVADKSSNLERAEAFLRRAAGEGAHLCLLPEMFQTPYELPLMSRWAERQDGESVNLLRRLARELSLYVVGGSICERGDAEDPAAAACYNTSYVVDSSGNVVGTHRKIHLFDVDLDKVKMRESDVFSPGEEPLVLDTPFCRLGVAICYDARFPEVFSYFEKRGVEVAAVPAAFSRTTGDAHWHILMRSRAVDYQIYVAAACPAPNPQSSYTAFGHSIVVDPWGTVLGEAGEAEESFTVAVSAATEARVRRELPLLRHRRADLYRQWKTPSPHAENA